MILNILKILKILNNIKDINISLKIFNKVIKLNNNIE